MTGAGGGGGYMDYPAWMGLGGMKDTCGVSPSRERERKRRPQGLQAMKTIPICNVCGLFHELLFSLFQPKKTAGWI